jgi:hypothetical protein
MTDNEAANYRATAEKLRRLAGQLRFDLCRREQLLALAEGFERLAERSDAPAAD